MVTPDTVRSLTCRRREDAAGTYPSWFLWEERLKNFRSIRRGIAQVVMEMESGSFGTACKGSGACHLLENDEASFREKRPPRFEFKVMRLGKPRHIMEDDTSL